MLRTLYDLIINHHLNIAKTIYFNFAVFPFKTAIHMPVCLFGKVKTNKLKKGIVELTGPISPATVRIGGGYESRMMGHFNTFKSYINIYGKIRFGNNVKMGNGICLFVGPKASVTIGNDVFFHYNCKLFSEKEISIGYKTRISWDTQIFDTNFHYLSHDGTIKSRYKSVCLEHNCWIGNRATVSKGTYLKAYSIVASNSVINKNYSENEPGGLYAGMPARLIGTNYQRLVGRDIEAIIDEKLKTSSSVSIEELSK